jgi:hypothetical protein
LQQNRKKLVKILNVVNTTGLWVKPASAKPCGAFGFWFVGNACGEPVPDPERAPIRSGEQVYVFVDVLVLIFRVN